MIIDVDEAEATVQMTRADIDAANEEQAISAANLRTEQGNLKALLQDEKNAEAALKAAREALRKNEIRRLELGDELATFAEQIHSGMRRITIKVVRTVTKGNELVVTDARDGKERERRTATADELEEAQGKTTSLFMPGRPDDPQHQMVRVLLNKEGFKGGRKSLPLDFAEVLPANACDDDEPFKVVWQPGEPGSGRSVAIVPRWVASRMRTIAGKQLAALELQVEELLPAASGGAVVTGSVQ